MLGLLRDKRSGLLLLAIVAALFILMAMQVRSGGASSNEGALLRLAGPVVRGAAGLARGATDLWDEYVDLRHTRRRNADLEEKVTLLQVELQRLEEARIQNDRLRSLLDLRDGMGMSSVAARLISNNSSGASHTILLDQGSASGLAPNMSVIAAQGVVGRVWTVAPRIAKVQLLTDAAAGTAVLVQRTRVQGILLGRGSGVLTVEYVSTLDDVKTGDLLVTSGLDGIHPKGLPVATVDQVEDGRGLFKEVTAIPRVESKRLEEVLVLLRNDLPGQETALGVTGEKGR